MRRYSDVCAELEPFHPKWCTVLNYFDRISFIGISYAADFSANQTVQAAMYYLKSLSFVRNFIEEVYD